jgi:hypothetical protein
LFAYASWTCIVKFLELNEEKLLAAREEALLWNMARAKGLYFLYVKCDLA